MRHGKDDTCGRRFGWELGELPAGYDHKYIYRQVGYNLSMTEMEAAVGLAQLRELSGFGERRRANLGRLRKRLLGLEHLLVLPEAAPGSDPGWFGFPANARGGLSTGPPRRAHEETRRHTAALRGQSPPQAGVRSGPRRVVGALSQADRIMRQSFWVEIYQGLSEAMLDFTADSLTELLRPPGRVPSSAEP